MTTPHVFGADHPTTLIVRGNLAVDLAKLRRMDDAIAAMRSVLADQVRVFGRAHAITADARSNLRRMLLHAGHADEAADL